MAGRGCFSIAMLLIAVITQSFLTNPCQCNIDLKAQDNDNCLDVDNVSYEALIAEENVIEMKVSPAQPHQSTGQPVGFRVELVHRDSLEYTQGTHLPLAERLRQAIERSNSRESWFRDSIQAKISAPAGAAPKLVRDIDSPVHAGNGEFLMQLGIGSPPSTYNAIVDTGSDLIWTQCKPCDNCYEQQGPIYDPSNSKTYSRVSCSSTYCQALPYSTCGRGCEYQYQYGDYSFTTGVLSSETFTLETTSGSKETIPGIAFGCGHDNEGSGFTQGGGIVGLGRGPLSLISQLGSKANHKFSYCLVSISDSASKTSPLLFGNAADLHGAGVKSTSFVHSRAGPTYYYLRLEGISVQGTRLRIPRGTFDIHSDGSGGFIIDSGTTLTYLEDAAYSRLKRAVQSKIHLRQVDGSAIGLDLCYTLPSDTSDVKVPSITFHFAGGADYNLPAENAFIADGESGLLCLAMASSSGLSILGNIQQQNFRILYDLGRNRLSFVQTSCDAL
eukprot:Gb_25235 [translate_table: standard]